MQEQTTEIVPRDTVETIVRKRTATLGLYSNAHAALVTASAELEAAAGSLQTIGGRENSFNSHASDEKRQFLGRLGVDKRKDYLASAQRIVDVEVWAHIIEITDLERLMDKEAKQQLRKQLMDNPPEVTVENIYATLEQFAADAGTIFKRGIANVFSKLDRRFRSHDGFKIGSRVILDGMYDGSGFMNYHRDMESTLMDIERTFMVLDDHGVPGAYAGIIGQLRESRYTGSGARQGELENEFFLIRVYKNGNCHCWFKRDDLVEKVNKLLADYYGEVIPDGMEPEDDGGLNTPKTSLAKNYGFFPTPDKAAQDVIEYAPLHKPDGAKALTVLEPSAGTGNLAALLVKAGAIVDCVEVQPALADELRSQRRYRKVTTADFLVMQPDSAKLYDRAVMNPPFDRERDIDHVMHALKFLKPDGCLVAIMSAGTEFRTTRKATAFRDLMTKMKSVSRDLPAGSFSSVGTNVNTIVLTVWNDGRQANRY